MLWVKVGYACGMRSLVVGLWWLGCWGGGHRRGWGGFWLQFCGGFRSGLLGWWVLWRFCGGFWMRFVLWVFYFIYFGGWGLRLVGGGGCGCDRG